MRCDTGAAEATGLALFVLLLSTLVRCQPTELIWAFFFSSVFHYFFFVSYIFQFHPIPLFRSPSLPFESRIQQQGHLQQNPSKWQTPFVWQSWDLRVLYTVIGIRLNRFFLGKSHSKSVKTLSLFIRPTHFHHITFLGNFHTCELLSNMITRAFIRSKKHRENIDIYRGFIRRFGLFLAHIHQYISMSFPKKNFFILVSEWIAWVCFNFECSWLNFSGWNAWKLLRTSASKWADGKGVNTANWSE
mgnify:CR=1 FL=1